MDRNIILSMNTVTRSRPYFPSENLAESQTKSFWRAMTATVIGTLRQENPEKIIERAWRDETALAITRAATSPMTTATGADLLPIGVAGFLAGLAGPSAAAALFQRCVRLNFDGVHQVM